MRNDPPTLPADVEAEARTLFRPAVSVATS